MDYYKFYIQKEGKDSTGAAYPVKELGEDFKLYEVESKFYGNLTVKDLPNRSWHDENGDDEFVPDVYKYKAYEMSVKLACQGKPMTSNTTIKALKDYLSGGQFEIYDTFNGIGRQHVRFVEIPDDAKLYRHKYGVDECLVFTLKMKVNDPVTDVTLKKADKEAKA